MAKVKHNFGEVRYLPWLGREVKPGEVFEVSDDDLASYLEGGLLPADKPTEARAKVLRAEGVVTVGAEPAAPASDEGKES